MADSLQNYIRRYVYLKIQSGDWNMGDKILSENQMAVKFNCSRLSARQALQPLIYSGVLEAKRGKGYIVSNKLNEISLASFAKKHSIKVTKLEMIDDPNGEYKELIGAEEFSNIIIFKKEYLRKGKVIAIQITGLNKDAFWNFSQDAFRKSITEALGNQGVMIKRNVSELLFSSDPKLKGYAEILGWNQDDFVIEKISSSTIDTNIEKTVRLVRRDEFNFKFVKFSF